MDQIEKLLADSIIAYRDLLAAYGDIETRVSSGGGVDVLEAALVRAADMAARAMAADTAFQEAAEELGAYLLEMIMFEQWLTILSQVIDENLRVKKYVTAAMAMTKDDLTRMKKGKAALSGYHSGEGRIINTGKKFSCGA